MTIPQILSMLPTWAAFGVAALGAVMGVFTALHVLFLVLSSSLGWKWAGVAADWCGVLAADVGKAVDLLSQLQAKRAALRKAAADASKVALVLVAALLVGGCSRFGVFSDPTLEALVDAFCGDAAVAHRAELEAKAGNEKLSPAEVVAAFQALCAARLKGGQKDAVEYAMAGAPAEAKLKR